MKIVAIECVKRTGIPLFSLDVIEDFTFEAYHCGSRCRLKKFGAYYIKKISRQSPIEEAIRFLKNLEITRKQTTFVNQIFLLAPITIDNHKYKNETIVQAFEYFVTSRLGYSKFRRDFKLPSVSTSTRLTSKVKKLKKFSFSQYLFKFFRRSSKNLRSAYRCSICQICSRKSRWTGLRVCRKQTIKVSQYSSSLHGCLYFWRAQINHQIDSCERT